MENRIEEVLKKVCDEQSFLVFLRALLNDRMQEVQKENAYISDHCSTGSNAWQNDTIKGFLESAIAWAEVSDNGLQHYQKERNAWKRCADILYMGKQYE